MTPRASGAVRRVVPFVAAAAVWEIFARSGVFADALTPSLVTVAQALGRMAADGSLAMHAAATVGRLAAGYVLAVAIGVPLGLAMGRWRALERGVLPIVTALLPVPSLAWVPLFILWFGLGNAATVLLVTYAAVLPIAFNAWSGVRTVNALWVRVAEAFGAGPWTRFRRVDLPGALPLLLTGLRLGLARSWRAVVSGEMIAATARGLGWLIFDAKEFLQTDVVIAAILVIGLIGLVLEGAVFRPVERATVQRWGVVVRAGE